MKTSRLHFIDYVRMFPSAWVFEHFLEKNDARRKILSSNAVQERVRHFSHADALRRQFESMDPGQRLQCSLAYLLGDSGLPAPESCVDHLKAPLVRSFLIYAGRNADGTVRYFGFPEFEPVLRPLFAVTIPGAAAVKLKAAPVSPRPAHCFNDIAAFMTLALQGLLEKKKQGGLTRTGLQKIARLTNDESEGMAGLLIYCALHMEILRENEKGYFPADRKFEEWLSAPADHRAAGLVRCAAEFAGSWCLELLRETLQRAGAAWLSCSVFPEKERTAAITALRIFRWAGLIEVAKAGGEIVFGAIREKSSAAPAEKKGAIVVLPDFSAVIAQEVFPEHLYGFGLIGTLQSLDRVYKGAIDRRVLNDSLAMGFQGETILARLTEWHAPANVIATVREWIREFHRLYITEGPMLVATDEKVSFEIGAYGPLSEYLEPLPAYAVFRIRPGAGPAVKEILTNAGFDHRMPISDRPLLDGKKNTETPAGYDVWEPVIRADGDLPKQELSLRGKKYGTGLKMLDLNETTHVIDYAVLTGQRLMVDYSGSPGLRKAVYTLTPLSRTAGAEPLLDGAIGGGRKKQFTIRKISRIGVVTP
ncbi:MAG: hypothetical protein ABSF80_09855 [Chitinispirillaceae bacterium]